VLGSPDDTAIGLSLQADPAGPHNIEQWFSILTRKLLRRGSFESQEDPENQITEFTIGYNKTAHPWKWRYDADAKHARYLQRHPDKDTLAEAA
jgi:hypothetical protein